MALADGAPPAPPASQMRAESMRNADKAAAPFTLQVEQVVPLAPPEWERLELTRLEVDRVNATSEAARSVIDGEIRSLKARLDDGPCVLLGQGPIAGDGRGIGGTAVLVPSGMGARAMTPGTAVRVTPSSIPWPPMAVGEASRAYPVLRLFGTPARPGFVAESIESVAAPTGSTSRGSASVPDPSRTPWGRAVATSLAESAQLGCDSPTAERTRGAWVPMGVTVRNTGAKALAPSEVFVEFLDSNGALVHREYRWVTPRDTTATEARLPGLEPGASTTIRVPVPASMAPRCAACRVMILRFLPNAPG